MRSSWLALLALGGLLGCAQTVRSNVEVFHEMPATYAGETISVLSGDEKKIGTMEFKVYAQKLEDKLQAAGFRVTAPEQGPKYVAFLNYAIGEGEQVVSTYSIPQYGVTGYSSANTYGTVNTYGNYGTYTGTTYYTPQYGITGYNTGVTSSTIFPRALVVSIFEVIWADVASSEQVYQLTVSSSGKCANLSAVIDPMLEAGFQDFPGESGSSKTIKLSRKSDC